MTVHNVRLLGDPVLRTRCQLVTDPTSSGVRMVADDLLETLHDLQQRHGFGRGLSAPQIGAPIRVVVLDHGRPMVLLNPEIIDVATEDFTVWDDCFSFVDLMVRVHRAHRVKVRYQDLKGRTETIELEGPAAELLQHELDHLEGILAVDSPAGIDPFCLREEWNRHYAAGGRYGKPKARPVPLTPV